MTINIFKGIYLVPPKCGSRFFDEHWGDRKILKPGSKLGSSDWVNVINREFIDLFELKDSKFVDKIEFIVLREPFEHIKTALHTEFINYWNGFNRNGDITETDLLHSISKEDSQSHWHRHIFRELYLFILKFKKPPTIIMLNNLNNFLQNELNENYSNNFSKKKYDFSEYKIYMSKDDLWDIYIKYNHPKEWLRLSNLLEGDEFFYNKLIKLCPLYNKRNLV
jgi:hypothetical protein